MKAPRTLSKTEEAAFERLMKAYPPRGDNPRAPARKVFADLMAEGLDAEGLVSAAVRYAEVIKAERRERRMIPHTRKWLFQRYFEDYMDAPASAGDAQPNPEHPLAWMVAEIGDGPWRSYIAPLTVDATVSPVIVKARTAFALAHIRKAWWDRMIEERLGAVDWQVKS